MNTVGSHQVSLCAPARGQPPGQLKWEEQGQSSMQLRLPGAEPNRGGGLHHSCPWGRGARTGFDHSLGSKPCGGKVSALPTANPLEHWWADCPRRAGVLTYCGFPEPHSFCLRVSTPALYCKSLEHTPGVARGRQGAHPASEPSEFQNLKSKQNLNVKAAGAQKPDLAGPRDPTPATEPQAVPPKLGHPSYQDHQDWTVTGVLSEQ